MKLYGIHHMICQLCLHFLEKQLFLLHLRYTYYLNPTIHCCLYPSSKLDLKRTLQLHDKSRMKFFLFSRGLSLVSILVRLTFSDLNNLIFQIHHYPRCKLRHIVLQHQSIHYRKSLVLAIYYCLQKGKGPLNAAP